MKKEKTINALRKRIMQLDVQKNSLAPESKAAAEDTIAMLEAMLADFEASDDEKTSEEVKKAILDIVDEKFAALAEKTEPDPTDTMSANYLASDKAVHDWCEAVREASRNSKHEIGSAYAEAWKTKLVENGISITSGSEAGYLPDLVKGKIQDKWADHSNWLNQLNITGAKRYAVRYQSADQDSTDVRAKGHSGTNTKTAQSMTMVTKVISTQMIYKLMPITNQTIFEDDGSLVNYVVGELYSQWLYEVARCVLVGDGRLAASDDKVKSIESIDRASTDAFVTVGTYNTSLEMIDQIVTAIDAINTNDGERMFLFATPADITAMRRVLVSTGATPQYINLDVMAEMLGVERIIKAPFLDASTSGAARFIVMRPDKYALVGSLSPAIVSWEDYLTNQTYWRSETPVGGGVEGLLSAYVYHNA